MINIDTFLSNADLLGTGLIILEKATKDSQDWNIKAYNDSAKKFVTELTNGKTIDHSFFEKIGLMPAFFHSDEITTEYIDFDKGTYKIEKRFFEQGMYFLKLERINESHLNNAYTDRYRENKLFQTLLDYSPDLIYFKDHKARFIKNSKSHCNLFGLKQEDLIGKTDLDVFKEGNAENKYADDLNVINTGIPIINKEETDVTPKGEISWVSSTKLPIRDENGEIYGLFGISRNISERKEAELKIERLNENFQELITMGLGFQQTAKINNLFRITGNLLLEKLKGIQLLFLYNRKPGEKYEVFSYPAMKSDNSAYRKLIEHILYDGFLDELFFDNGRATVDLPLFLKKNALKGFGEFTYKAASIYQLNEKNNSFGHAFIFRNKEFEEHDIYFSKVLFNQLSLTIARIHLIEELKHSVQKAEESDRLKTAFLNNISHEVRTPLNSVVGYSQLLMGKIQEEDPKLKSYAEHVISNAKILLELIEDIIEISKIQSGKVSIIQQETNINDLIDTLGSYLKEQVTRRGKPQVKTELLKQLQKEEAIFQLDSSRVYQAIKALISNAVKFTDEGSIRVGYLVDANDINFFVEDTGIGITDEMSTVIFNLFRQGDETITRKYGGVGVGLSIANSLAKHLGGKITFKTKPQEGSTFFLSVPV